MDASEFKHVVLSLIFLKYVSDTFAVRRDELARLVDDESSDYYMPSDAEAGLEQPDLSLIDDSFKQKFTQSEHKNVQLEMLKQLLAKEVRTVERRNIIAGRQFSEMLAEAMNKYHNRSIDQAEVMAALIDLAKVMRAQGARATELGLSDKEVTFYEALRTTSSPAEAGQASRATPALRQRPADSPSNGRAPATSRTRAPSASLPPHETRTFVVRPTYSRPCHPCATSGAVWAPGRFGCQRP